MKSKIMRAIRPMRSLVPAIAFCLASLSAASAGAALIAVPQQTQLALAQTSFSLTLRLDEPLVADRVIDSMWLDVSYAALPGQAAVSLTDVELLEGLPAPWTAMAGVESVNFLYASDASSAMLPAGDLMRLTFAVLNPGQPFSEQISTALFVYNITTDPNPIPIQPNGDLHLTSAPVSVTNVPEPGAFGLLAIGLALVATQRMLSNRRNQGGKHVERPA